MIVYRGLNDPRLRMRPRSLAVGIFDGVHRGHQAVLRAALLDAKRHRTSPMAVTFDPHPMRILQPARAPKILQSLEHRLRLLRRSGMREALVIRFDRRTASMSAPDFLERILIRRLGLRFLAAGHDFRFGYRGAGDHRFLREAARRLKFRWRRISAYRSAGEIVSSTAIRNYVEKGMLKRADALLGRPYSIMGTVVRGRGRGRRVGYPTANVDPHHEALPPEGVYAAWAYLDSKPYRASVHIGKRPTFADRQKSLEIHFLDIRRNLYGQAVELVFVRRLRAVRKFPSAAALGLAIQKDVQQTIKLLALQTPREPV